MFSKDKLFENHIYNEISDRLLSQLDLIRISPSTILNSGAHTENSGIHLHQRYPGADIKNTVHFDELKNYKPNTFQLIIAQFPLLYDGDPMRWLYAFYHLLSDDGLLLFTSLGPDTFIELRQSFALVNHYPHVHTFSDMHDVGDWMRSLHFSDPVMHREVITLAYDDLDLFFEELKIAGVTNLHPKRFRGLTTKNQWQNMLTHYQKFNTDGYFPVTLEVVYGHGWKIKSSHYLGDGVNEVVISLDQIKRRK